MFKFVSKALLSMVMDKDARATLERVQAAKKTEKASQNAEPVAQTAKPRLSVKREKTPEREALIQNAIKLHQEKAKVLDNLSPEEKEKLQVMAAMTFLGVDKLPPPKK
jgi:hypothetical protein